MNLDDLVVEVRDRDYVRVGTITAPYLQFEALPVLNGVGTWSLTLPQDHHLHAALSEPGAGVVVSAFGEVMLSGPVTQPETEATTTDPGHMTTFKGVTDEVHLWDRVVYPDPTEIDPSDGDADEFKMNGPSHTVIAALVLLNLGGAAPVERRHPLTVNLYMDGPSEDTTRAFRFDVLGEAIAEIANANDLVFHLRQALDGSMNFRVAPGVDRTDTVALSVDGRTLAGYKMSGQSPTTTHVIAGSSEINFDRLYEVVTTQDSVSSAALWGRRIEKFMPVSETTVDWDQPEQANPLQPILDTLKSGGVYTATFNAIPIEHTEYRFGRDWNLGDFITVEYQGQPMRIQVSGFALRVTSEGVKFGLMLGENQNPFADLSKRIDAVERDRGKVTEIDESLIDPNLLDRVQQALDDANAASQFAQAATTVFRQGGQPATGSDGDIWFDTTNGNHIYVYDNGWKDAKDVLIPDESLAGKVITASVVQSHAAANTGVKLHTNGLVGYGAGGTPSFILDAAAGSVTLAGGLHAGVDISGATITGGVVQSNTGANQGIKFNDTNLIAYDGNGDATFSITAATGAIAMKGSLLAGSDIEGATITGGTFQTAAFVGFPGIPGIRINEVGMGAYDNNENRTFHINASTGAVTLTGGLIRTSATTDRGVLIDSHGIRAYGSAGDLLLDLDTNSDDARISVGTGNEQITLERDQGNFDSGGVVRFGNATVEPLGLMQVRNTIIPTDVGSGTAEVNRMHILAKQAMTLEARPPEESAYGSSTIDLHYSRGALVVNGYTIWSGRAGGGFFIDSTENTTNTANATISANGRIYRITSKRESKLAIQPIPTDQVKNLLNVPVVSWYDRYNTERFVDALDAGDEQLVDIQPIIRIPGVVAEDVVDAGAGTFAHYDENGELAGVAYDRIGVAWIPLVRELYERVEYLEAQLASK